MPRQQQQPQAADHGLGHGGQGQRGEACHLQQQRRRLYRSLLLLPLLLLVLLLLGLATCPLAAAFIVPSPRTSSSSIQSSRQHQQRPSLVPRSLGLDFFGGNKNKKRPQKLPEQSPFRPELQIEYKDGLGAKIWIYLFSGKIAKVTQSKLPPFPISYDDYVRLSVVLQKGGPAVAKDAVLSVLRSIAFPGFTQLFRALFPGTSRLACEFNARITPIFFDWLVGPATVEAAEVVNPRTGEKEMWRSTVHIQRCRYLEAVQCKGACASICKVPTQSFFTEDLGMPVTMTPDLTTLSCTMTFGQPPPPLAEDPVGAEPCYKECPSAKVAAKACPKLTALAQQQGGVEGGGGGGGGGGGSGRRA